MKYRTYLPALVVVCLMSFAGLVHADGSAAGSGSAVVAAPSSAAPVSLPDTPDAENTVKMLYKAITTKDWFMLAGVGLAVIIYAARYLLKKKWPSWDKSHYGVALAAAISGVTALSLAWMASEPVTGSHTLMGALKLFAAATFAYVIPKKIAEAGAQPTA